MALPNPRSEQISQLITKHFSDLFSLPAMDFFLKMDKNLDAMLEHEDEFASWFLVCGEENKEELKKILTSNAIDAFEADTTNYANALESLTAKNGLRNRIIREYLKNNTHGLPAYEAEIIDAGCLIGSATDEFFLAWHENLFRTGLAKKIQAMEHESSGSGAEYLQKLGIKHQYSLYGSSESEHISYAAYVPSATEKIRLALEQLDEKLSSYSEEICSRYRKYFLALKTAYTEENLDKLDAAWEAVDVAWLSVKGGNIEPVHAMETNYMDPAHIRVMPEFRVFLRDSRYQRVQQNAELTQKNLIEDLGKLFPHLASWKNSERAMTNSSFGIYVPMIFSGADLVFKMVGQTAPCRNHLRIQYGSKISMNMESCKKRFERELFYSGTIFGKPFRDMCEQTVSPEDNLIYRVAAHEVSHAAFVSPETDERIGNATVSLLEEAKATWGLYATAKDRYDALLQKKFMLLLVMSALRYLVQANNQSSQPYYRESLMEIQLLLRAQVLQKQGDTWSFHEEKFDDFFVHIKKTYTDLVNIYDTYDAVNGKKMLLEFSVPTSETLDLQKLLSALPKN